MKKKLLPISVFIISLIAGLIYHLPVVHLMPYLALDKSVQLAGVSGTLFEGRVKQIGLSGVRVQNVGYEMQAGCLVLLSICYQLNSADNLLNVEFQPISESLIIEDSLIDVDLSDITPFIPNLLIKPAGQIALQLSHLEMVDQQLQQVSAVMDWRNAGISGETVVFGDFQLSLSKQAKRYIIKLKDTGGDVKIDGSGFIKEAGQYKIDVDIKTKTGIAKEIQNTLDLLAKKTSATSYQINQSGQLPSRLSGFLAF